MNDTYDASHITVLEGLTPVRERPAMYIGSTDSRGLHHLVYEVVDNSIDEALAGFCSLITATLATDGSIIVEDNGRGIPVDMMEKNGKSALEVVLTVLHAGGKFDKATYQVSGGLHGVGVSVVNALSVSLAARVYRNGNIYDMRFAQGKVASPISSRQETLEANASLRWLSGGESISLEGAQLRGQGSWWYLTLLVLLALVGEMVILGRLAAGRAVQAT